MGAPRIMSGSRDPRAFNPAARAPQSVFDSWLLLPAPPMFFSKVILMSDWNPFRCSELISTLCQDTLSLSWESQPLTSISTPPRPTHQRG